MLLNTLLAKYRLFAALPHFHLNDYKIQFGCINCIYLVSEVPNTMYNIPYIK